MIINDTCRTVKVYDYYMAIESNDKRYLIKNYEKDYVRKNIDLKLTPSLKVMLEEAFKKVSFEYQCLNVDKRAIAQKKAEIEIATLTYRYEIINRVIEIYDETLFIDVFDLLNEIDVKFDKSNNVSSEINKLLRICKHIRNNIKIRKINYLKKFDKDSKQSTESLLKNISKRALYISLNLEMKSNINIEKTSLYDWVNLNELNESKTALIKNMRNG